MCEGISLLRAAIPQQLFERYALGRLVHRRTETADEELWFQFEDRALKAACLPVLHQGEVEIYEWGNRNHRTPRLPKSGLCGIETLEKGLWQALSPERVTILANLCLDNGVWYTVNHGIEGILVRTADARPHVYMLTKESTHYYKILTGHARGPVLIKQVI